MPEAVGELNLSGMNVVQSSFLPPDTVLLVNTRGMGNLPDLRPPLDLVSEERKQAARVREQWAELAAFIEDPDGWAAEREEALAFAREVLRRSGCRFAF